MKYRMTCWIQRRVNNGQCKYEDLTEENKVDLGNLNNGNLRKWANSAIIAYGHGSVRRADGATMAIGGSTGGITRRLLDGHQQADADDFLSLV